jgi:hypothetical protein
LLVESINKKTKSSADDRRTSQQFAESLGNVTAKIRHEDDRKPCTEGGVQ